MGCDIHAYFEYRHKGKDWLPLGGRMNLGRDYEMFTYLAGVRGDPKDAVVSPKGYPKDAAYMASSDNHLFIVDQATDSEGYAERSQAERWVANGSSEYKDETKKFVTHPDWHTHSWLTTDEFAKALEAAGSEEYRERYYAMLTAMDALEVRGFEARVVFWFDN